MNNKANIDAVVAWVDGNDQKLKDKKTLYQQSEAHLRDGSNNTRFTDSGEIEFCVRSLFKYAPWIGSVYIVTDDQIPSFIALMDSNLQQRIKIVDHTELFKGYEEALPVFNSLAIETMLWNIEGLSENFIYLNDDMMMVRSTPIKAFIDHDKFVFDGTVKKIRKPNLINMFRERIKSKHKYSFRKVKERSAALVANKKQDYYLDLPHCPYIMNRVVLKKIFKLHPDACSNNLRYRFRDNNQLWTVALFVNYVYYRKRSVISNKYKSSQIKGMSHSEARIEKELNRLDIEPDIHFFCIQGMEQMSEKIHNKVLEWLQQHYKEPSVK